MTTCEVCGIEYDEAFTITLDGESHSFDSFECAIHALASRCAHCGCKVVGQGVEKGDAVYCCVHCARHEGVSGLKDRG